MRRPAFVIGLLLLGCGGDGGGDRDEPTTAATPGTPVGMTETAGGERPEGVDGSIELTLRRSDGAFIEVGEQRGRVVLLFVLATFDGVSQMQLNPLREIVERHRDLVVIGIAAQPSARLLVDAYENALEPPFPITYDPRDTVNEGRSQLGEMSIPTLIVLDPRGVEVARHRGFADRRQIEALLRAAR